MDQQVKVSKTTKGKPLLILAGHEYIVLRTKGEKTIWRCSKNRQFKCRGLVTTIDKNCSHEVVKGPTIHSHDTNLLKSQAREVKVKMKESGCTTTRNALGEGLVGVDEDTAVTLPRKESLMRMIRRVKSKQINRFPIPKTLNFNIPAEYDDMILFDSGREDPKRIIVLGDRDLANDMNTANLVFADGTFDKAPELFYQLYSFHIPVGNSFPAVIYCLLPDKTKEIYEKVTEIILQICPEFAPSRLLIDFELAVIRAFKSKFPDMDISGCFFHLNQSIIRKLNSIGLKLRYEREVEFQKKVKSLAALSFVPEQQVPDIFEQLVECFDENDDQENELLTYFSTNYIQGIELRHGRRRPPLFNIGLWNHYESALKAEPRTTNCCEGFHNSLNAIFLSPSPSVWALFEGIRKDIAISKFLKAKANTGAPEHRNLKYKQLAEQIANAVQLYDAEPDKLKYLRHLSSLQ